MHEGSDLNDDSLNEVVLAVDLRDRGNVGCAYYLAQEERLHMMDEVKLGGIEIIDARKHAEDGYRSTDH